MQLYKINQMRLRVRNEGKKNGNLNAHNEETMSFMQSKDQEQNEGLANRSHINKVTYKYLEKIDKAGDVIKEARNINQFRAQLLKNGGNKRNLMKKESSESKYLPENVHVETEKMRDYEGNHDIIGKGTGNESMDNNTDTKRQSIVGEEMKINMNELQQSELPIEIVEGEISKSILSIDYEIVKNYFKGRMIGIEASSSPQKIYKIFNPFYQLCGMNLSLPLVKRYKNCAFFGDSNKKDKEKYEGFLIFHEENKLYFGEFLNEKKDGRGTQIDFKTNTVFIGTFTKGRKSGTFTVIKPHQRYVGKLRNGLYEGYGELSTDFSKYKGSFEKGQRHGQGQQTFLSMGLTICGTFVNNKFTNKQQKIDESRLNSLNSNNSHDFSSLQADKLRKMGKPMNPERLTQTMDLNQNRNKTFEIFDCDFIVQEEEISEIQIIKERKAPAFRIKDLKDTQKSYTQRKRAASETKDAYLHSTLKH